MTDIALIIAIVLILISLIVVWRALADIKYAGRIMGVYRTAVNEANLKTTVEKAKASRAADVADMFADILADIAHTEDQSSITWKLSTIRHAENIMRCPAWADNNMYQCMRKILYDQEYKDFDEITHWIECVDTALKRYYVMDADTGKNITDALVKTAVLTSGIKETEKSHYLAEQVLMDLIRSLKLNFAMAEEPMQNANQHLANIYEVLAVDKADERSDTNETHREDEEGETLEPAEAVPGDRCEEEAEPVQKPSPAANQYPDVIVITRNDSKIKVEQVDE